MRSFSIDHKGAGLEFLYLESSFSEWNPVAGSCEHGDEISGPIKVMNVSLAGRILTSQEGLCSVELVT
jgi:hypothetical protein